MHPGSLVLLLLGSAIVAVVHSVLPDHWVPLAVVARSQRWSLLRVGRISALAATGHVLVSLALAAAVALVGLRFQAQVEAQQGHLVGALLFVTGLGFLAWGLTGHGHAHPHGEGGHGHEAHDHDPHDHDPHDHDPHDHDPHDHDTHDHDPHDHDPHDHDPHHHDTHDHDPHDHDPHEHEHPEPVASEPAHGHEHEHAGVVHSHAHSHAVFIAQQQVRLEEYSKRPTLAGRLATIAVPFGVAASPDLTILPIALAASAYGTAAVLGSLVIFAVLTIGTFVGLTIAATAAGYQFKGEWLEKNANTITSLVLMAVGVVAFVGF